MLMRLIRTVALFWPMSEAEKGCRTQLVSVTVSASIMTTSRPSRWPQTRIAWSRYGNPMTTALPVPPAPMIRTRTARWRNRSDGRVCSIRMLPPVSTHELRQRLWQPDQRFDWKRLAFVRQAVPKPIEASFVTGQTADIGMCEGALIEAPFPVRDRGYSCAVWAAHRAGADATVFREVPKRSDRQRRPRGRTFVLSERTYLQVAVIDSPDQRRLRKRAAIQSHGLLLRVVIEHLAAAHRRPPRNHAIAFGKHVFRKDLGRGTAHKRAHQRLKKSESKGLGWFECGWRALVKRHLMPGQETPLTVSVDQQRLTQLEAMVLPDRDLYLHGVSPIPAIPRQAETERN